eukprot:gene4996-6377_t
MGEENDFENSFVTATSTFYDYPSISCGSTVSSSGGYCGQLSYVVPGVCNGTVTISGSTGVIISSSEPASMSEIPTLAPTAIPTTTAKPVTFAPTTVGFVAPAWNSTLNTVSAWQNYYY